MHVLHGGPVGTTYALYGAREPLLHPPVQFADEAAIHAFLEPYFQAISAREQIRQALIAQGIFALADSTGLRSQTTHALQTGILRPAPVAVSGLQPTELARPSFSGQPYIPPRRENPRPEPKPPEPRYKIALEIAGQSADSLAGALAISPQDSPNALRMLPSHAHGTDSHRLESALKGLPNTPFSLWYQINMQGGAPMRLHLIESIQPVDQDAQQARWPTVLVPVLPLRHNDAAKNSRSEATRPAHGWMYVFINGFLFRELQVVNTQGTLRDVDLGAADGVGDQRTARGLSTNQIVVPYLLAGEEQKVAMVYSRRPFTWAALMKLGGINPADPRFTAVVKKDAAAIPVDDNLRKQFLQPVDLSSYGSGFSATAGAVGPVADALRNDDPEARDPLSNWREERVPVVYLVDRPAKKTVVPVPYVAGIFGSREENLSSSDLGVYVWDPDDTKAITKAYAKSLLSAFVQRDWTDAEINDKTQRLHHPGATVMTGHDPDAKADVLKAIKASEHFQRRLHDAGPNADEDVAAEQEYQRRKTRGWFGVLSDYVPLFEAIEAIDDEHFIYVAYAVGTDWRNDLSKAAEHLKTQIDRIQAITDYPELGTKGVHYEAGTHKALVVTHSQGSLIARYASEVLGANANIQGIVHLNQPTTGAPVLYRRFIGGSRPEREPWYKLTKLPDNVFAEILGTTSYHFTRMAGPMAGALSLLPTNDHVTQAGATDGGWLSAPAALLSSCPGNIYDAYLNDKVGLISHKRYDMFSKTPEPRWYDIPLPQVQDRSAIPPDAKLHLPEETPWHQDNMRLRPHAGMTDGEWKVAEDWYAKFEKFLHTAQAFHAALGLKYHPNTYVIRSNGANTVTHVRLLLNTDKNGNAVLDCPYERTKEGDGTVPLTSQESLVANGASPAGPVITKGHVVHADICKHPEAIVQTKDAITKLVEPLRPKNQDWLYVSNPAVSAVRVEES
ncbi:MAG: hypothetical protein HY273_10875 [Gammaproteobacteria bacterium]|nr:hypothetical protein [Gammaproteobacteria bacterium]